MKTKKTVMEWLGDKKLYDKKIIKLLQQIRDTQLFAGKPNLYADKEAMKKDMSEAKALVDSYIKMNKNINKIQEAIMKFNATHTIEISGKEFTISAALKMYKDYDSTLANIIKNNINQADRLKKQLEDKQEVEVKTLEQQLNSSNKQVGNQAFEDKLKSKKEDYEPIMEYAFDLVKAYTEMEDFKEEFLQSVNTKINILNVQETLEINLDE